MGRRFQDQLGWDTGGKLARIPYDMGQGVQGYDRTCITHLSIDETVP